MCGKAWQFNIFGKRVASLQIKYRSQLVQVGCFIGQAATGKSGGYRVFSFYMDAHNPVFLLWIIDKSEDDTLTDAQEQVFKALTTTLKKELRT